MKDRFTPSPNPELNYKYSEEKLFKEVQDYITSTYGQHYVGSDGIQVIDLLHAIGISEEMCRSNIIKYASRYGRKDGRNRKDLLKVLHYSYLLLHFSDDNDKNKT